jgi:hypothetical protein
MRFLPFLSLAVIALLSNACEKQPVGDDPDPRVHNEHGLTKRETSTGQKKEESEKRADGPKFEEAPKFFPDKK